MDKKLTYMSLATSENKSDPMPGKISGVEADALNDRRLINTGPQIDHNLGHIKVRHQVWGSLYVHVECYHDF